MNKLMSWAFGSLAAATASQKDIAGAGEKCLDKECTQATLSTADQSPVLRASDADPKVAEFFNDFPEPYRQKAIQRFSSRDGLYRWDIFRTYDMQTERDFALRGIFLEDKREIEELERQDKELKKMIDREELKKLFHERQIPEWEQATLKVIPLQPGDSMLFKFFQSSGLVVVAALGLTAGVLDKKNPLFTKRRANIGLAAGVYIFLCCNVIAAARLMDLGPFDRSVDDRFWHEKIEDDLKEAFKPITKILNDGTSHP